MANNEIEDYKKNGPQGAAGVTRRNGQNDLEEVVKNNHGSSLNGIQKYADKYPETGKENYPKWVEGTKNPEDWKLRQRMLDDEKKADKESNEALLKNGHQDFTAYHNKKETERVSSELQDKANKRLHKGELRRILFGDENK